MEKFLIIRIDIKDVEVLIIKGTLEGKTYEEMANAYHYTTTYLQTDVAHKMWRLLKQVFEAKSQFTVLTVIKQSFNDFTEKQNEEIHLQSLFSENVNQ